MRKLLVFALLSLSGQASAAEPPATFKATANSPTAVVNSADETGTWCRAANGGVKWVERSAVPQSTPKTTKTRSYSYYRPQVITTYPDSSPPQRIMGIEWYLDGRGPFSD